jgi:hypothetical protein
MYIKFPAARTPVRQGLLFNVGRLQECFPSPPPHRVSNDGVTVYIGAPYRVARGGGHGREPGSKAHPCILTHEHITVFVMHPMQLLCMHLYFP